MISRNWITTVSAIIVSLLMPSLANAQYCGTAVNTALTNCENYAKDAYVKNDKTAREIYATAGAKTATVMNQASVNMENFASIAGPRMRESYNKCVKQIDQCGSYCDDGGSGVNDCAAKIQKKGDEIMAMVVDLEGGKSGARTVFNSTTNDVKVAQETAKEVSSHLKMEGFDANGCPTGGFCYANWGMAANTGAAAGGAVSDFDVPGGAAPQTTGGPGY